MGKQEARPPRKNCQKFYIGKTGRSFEVCMNEHRRKWNYTKVRNIPEAPGNNHSQSRTNLHLQTMLTENHVINWEEATVIGWDSAQTKHCIREAVKIRQEAQDVMNRDDAVFLLSHVYDDILLPMATTVATASREFSVRKRQRSLPKRESLNFNS